MRVKVFVSLSFLNLLRKTILMSNYRSGFRGGQNSNSNSRKSFSGRRWGSGGNRGRRFWSGGGSRGPSLNPMMFVMKAKNVQVDIYQAEHSFSDFDLVDQLKRNIADRGYVRPTAIQDQAIKPLLAGKDLVGLADTGSGKTAAFLLPLINKSVQNDDEKVLIVAPTRELAMQIRDELNLFIECMNLYCVLCIGGASMYGQKDGLRKNPNFVIGTPGRILDLEKRKLLNLHTFNNVVLDEVDRMMDMGFIKDVREITAKLPKERQSLFFSATIPQKTRSLMDEFLNNPVTVSVKTGSTAQNVDQDIVKVNGRNKVELLHELLIQEGFDKVLVFGRTKWGINKLESALRDRGFKAAAIHGNKTQGQRQRALQLLRQNRIQVLLATDVASRGLDIDDVTHVINYDVPTTYDDYVHRIGRTGRAGKKGVALTIVD